MAIKKRIRRTVVNLAGPQSELLFWPCGNCDKLRTCPYCLWLFGGLLQWENKKTGSGARRGLHHRVRRVAGRFLRWERRVPSCVSLKDRPSLGLCDLTRGAIGQGTHHLHSFIPGERNKGKSSRYPSQPADVHVRWRLSELLSSIRTKL